MPKPRHRLALPNGFRLGSYLLRDQLGAGGFGITYLAADERRRRAVAIKELLPSAMVTRCGGVQVEPHSDAEDSLWRWAQERFAEEADTVAACRHPNVLEVYEVFRANGTVYMVSRYEEGCTLEAWLAQTGTLAEPDLRALLHPILSALETVHGRGFLHRDIKPDNIYLARSGQPILIDFGSARQMVTSHSQPLTAVLTPGYAPFEQYSSTGEQGPWTDLYALAAVMYRSITGQVPEDASNRVIAKKDPCVRLANAYRERYDRAFLASIDEAMAIEERRRTRSVEQWRARLERSTARHSGRETPPPAVPPRRDTVRRSGNDLHCDVPVAPRTARRGAAVQVPVGTSRLTLRIPPATAEGTVFRLRGKGLPGRDEAGERGDLYVKVTLRDDAATFAPLPERSLRHGLLSLLVPGLGSLRSGAILPCLLVAALVAALYFKWLARRVEEDLAIAVAAAAILVHLVAVIVAWRSAPQGSPHFWPKTAGGWIVTLLLGLSLGGIAPLGLAPGDARVEDGITFRWCPPGSFLMGSPDGSGHDDEDERPRHEEKFAQGFWIAETELTQEQWARGIAGPGTPVSMPSPRLPMVMISRNDCDLWCQRENGRTPITPWRFDLPTERQWEYACRAGTTTPFAIGGGTLSRAAANFNAGDGQPLRLMEAGAPGHANRWHISDMHGSVWEWCRDSYLPYPGSTVPMLPIWMSHYICRGGSFRDPASMCRSATRYHDKGDMRTEMLGFRPVLTRGPEG